MIHTPSEEIEKDYDIIHVEKKELVLIMYIKRKKNCDKERGKKNF